MSRLQALALITIKFQILMSASMISAAVPRTILACGIMFELFGIFISLLLPNQGNCAPSPTLFFIVRGALIVPIIVGVLGLTTTIIMIVVNLCPAAAIAIACTFVFGTVVCLLLFRFSARH
jgi:hypothetical protein